MSGCRWTKNNMPLYPLGENGNKVNMIKQKFEQNVSPKERQTQLRDSEEQKDVLRRSLSASPVKSKKNLKLNVSRQLSNPGKNIKRTPAFRGDKLSRTKNLQSPTKERLVSIVNQNVKMFEDKPEYGKLGNVKKKNDETTSDGFSQQTVGCSRVLQQQQQQHDKADKAANIAGRYNGWRDLTARETTLGENTTVKTTVISRQKNISPIYPREDEAAKFDRFFKNGAEYTKVTKQNSRPPVFEDKSSRLRGDTSVLDIREELSRRITAADSNDDDDDDDDEDDEDIAVDQTDGAHSITRKFKRIEDKSSSKSDDGGKLSDTLKAALQAPLPPGPPPKKPPRTFAHSPVTSRCNAASHSDEDNFRGSSQPKPRETRDSKKMLEKLEHVLIQHQKALGPKVIMPRKDKRETRESTFGNRLSRTLEDSKKLAASSLPKTGDSKSRKHSTFDCLPSLNCASSSVYEHVKSPNFSSYLTEGSLRESQSSKSQDSLETSISNLLTGNSEFYTTSPASKRLSTELSTFLDGKRRLQINSSSSSEERVYAEPFAFDKNSGTDITGFGILSANEHNYFSRVGSTDNCNIRSEEPGNDKRTASAKPELHYMCTSIRPLVYEDNNNEPDNVSPSSKIQRAGNLSNNLLLNMEQPPVRPEPDKFNKIKVEELLNQAFGKFVMAGAENPSDSGTSSDADSLASSPSISDQLPSFNDKLRLFKNRENGTSMTMATTHSKDELHRSLTENRKNYVRRVSSKYSERREGEPGLRVDRRNKLFQVCLLVELNLSTREPYIKDKYPIYAKTPAWIENFCFPDASNWPPSDSNQNQFYSLVLMDERGNRRYGYCCRVRPEDGPILPLAYCLITEHRASGFYRKVLLELESRHGLPDKRRRSFIEQLYNSPMPKPGQSLRIVDFPGASSSIPPANNNFINSKLPEDSGTMLVLQDSDSDESLIVRSTDPRLEERDMSQLFDTVSNKLLIILFGSLLLERKLVLLSDKLSTLSSCVEALQSLLYPFTWPHTFIPVLPDIPGLSEILEAPLPFVIGILKSKRSVGGGLPQISSIRDAIVVDLDTSKIVHAMGDESSILPSRLQKGIRSALQLVSSNTKSGDGIRNFLVSEAFLRVFVETCSHCDSHLVTQQDGKVIFQKESFVKASSSKTVQYFLEWFVETTMFNTFVQDCIARIEAGSSPANDDVKLFYQRVAEYQRGAETGAQSKKASSKKKTLGDRFKDLTNFHT